MPRKTQSALRIPDVDPKSPAGQKLTDAVQEKLKQFLGADYTDRSLSQYVVVMLAHKTEQHQLGENLVEFLGAVDSQEVASWLFENLHALVKAPVEPEPEQVPQQAQQAQQQQAQQQQQQGGGAAAASGPQVAAVPAAAETDGDALELSMESGGGSGSQEGDDEDERSDADTAELVLGQAGASGAGAAGTSGSRRLQSAVVRDEYRRRDERRGRSRSGSPRRRHSPPPPRRRSYSPRDGRRRYSPPHAARYFEGATGNRYLGHDPYPYRAGASWRGERSPPRRRSPSPPGGGRGHGRWGPPAPPPMDAFSDVPRWWGPPPPQYRDREQYQQYQRREEGGVFARLEQQQYQPQYRDGGGGGGGFRSQQHFQHDVRWAEGAEEPQYKAQYQQRHDDRPRSAVVQLSAPPGLAPGVPVPGGGEAGLPRSGSGGGRERGLAAAEADVPYDAGMGSELLSNQQQQVQQQAGQAALPWERPSYMDLEQQRQQRQQQAQQAQHAQVTPAAAGGAGAAGAAFARALAQAATTLGLEARGGAAGPPGSQPGSAASFQVTITPGGQRQLSAPLLHQPDLQQVLRQRVRQMELELVKLRAEHAERRLAEARQAQQHQELGAAAKLELTMRTVCVCNVHVAASERVLIAHFGSCGFIEHISFLREPVSGRKTGVAFIQFSAAPEAQAALALDGSALLQRTIQVVPPDSPAARVATSQALRPAFPPPGLVPLPFLAGPMPPPPHFAGGRGRRSGGRGGGRGRGHGHGSWKYTRPADAEEHAPGSAAAAHAVPAAPAGHGSHDSGDQHMAD